jgi:hypothetical protein
MKYSDRQWFRRLDELELVSTLNKLASRRPGRVSLRWVRLLGAVIRTHRFFWTRGIRL